MKRVIGFMGLGIMGVPMTANLLKAGFEVVVFNRTPGRADEVVALGARQAATPAELAAQCDVAVIMVTGPEAIDALLFGEHGAAEGLKGKPCVQMSSVAPSYTRELNERLDPMGVTLIDAPVSGSKVPAENAQLIILAGGPRKVVDELDDVLLAMGKKVVWCGDAGQGSMMKMMINHLLGVMVESFAEALRFGEKGGLDMEAMLDVILSGPLSCGMFQLKAPMIRDGEYPVNFPLKHMTKDMKFVLDTAYELGAGVPVGMAALEQYARAVRQGYGDEDLTAVDRVFSE